MHDVGNILPLYCMCEAPHPDFLNHAGQVVVIRGQDAFDMEARKLLEKEAQGKINEFEQLDWFKRFMFMASERLKETIKSIEDRLSSGMSEMVPISDSRSSSQAMLPEPMGCRRKRQKMSPKKKGRGMLPIFDGEP